MRSWSRLLSMGSYVVLNGKAVEMLTGSTVDDGDDDGLGVLTFLIACLFNSDEFMLARLSANVDK